MVISNHYLRDNRLREKAIVEKCGGDGNIIAKYYWDRNHSNGAEWHYITDHGIILIVNVVTDIICTKLIARPNQLTRYGKMGMVNILNEKTKKMCRWLIPNKVLNIASLHERLGLNLI